MQQDGLGVPPPTSWAQGLTPAQQREWLVDCYRCARGAAPAMLA
jgi:hypothetical protein